MGMTAEARGRRLLPRGKTAVERKWPDSNSGLPEERQPGKLGSSPAPGPAPCRGHVSGAVTYLRPCGVSGAVAGLLLLGTRCVPCVRCASAEAGSASCGAMSRGSGVRTGAGVWGPRAGAAAHGLVLRLARSPVRAPRWPSPLGRAQALPGPPWTCGGPGTSCPLVPQCGSSRSSTSSDTSRWTSGSAPLRRGTWPP